MVIVVLTNYPDCVSENIYTGECWKEAMKAMCNHYCANFRVQQWDNGTLVEEWVK